MAELLKLRQAARLINVSPGRLYRAITDGRLQAAPGGGPGKPTLLSLEAVQAFCQREGLHMPEAVERAERSIDDRTFQEGMTQQLQQAFDAMAAQYLARVVERQSAYIDAFLREELTHLVNRLLEGVVDQVVERVTERIERSERSERSIRSSHSARSTALPPPATPDKAAILHKLRTMHTEGFSLQAMADRLNAEDIPTLSGKGRWQKGTIGKLLS
jgi:recombinase